MHEHEERISMRRIDGPNTDDGRNHQLSVGIDTSKYEALLADAEISDEDKRELIQALWSIVSSFVKLGFGVHPAQLAMRERDCGQDPNTFTAGPQILLKSENERKEEMSC
tara:strand:+ start:197 stop:526 length:330 start_codon:yes stop_codon:yes gene_type:complete